MQYDDEAHAMARERTLIERQMVQEAEGRIKDEQALESIAIAKQAEDEDAAFLATRRAELDAEVRRAQEARLVAEREGATAAAKRSAAEARAAYEAGRKADVVAELGSQQLHTETAHPTPNTRLRLVMTGVLAMLIGTALGSSSYLIPSQLWHKLLGENSAPGELKLRLDDTLQRPPIAR